MKKVFENAGSRVMTGGDEGRFIFLDLWYYEINRS